ncbi:mRNA-capping enzyme subunit beta [Gracilariopsis chorda]|uniref:mRNA 5'-phosphatase n=1 Tax=Gracilariopsis chorda TaxID=448386 RepID=A0A2V3IS13_9FLOR|nr:mRNA-capping enzyme subunit beta [Gracilariopsis chorda]|eukprot:PXF44527.1 mRNA-capping enzyme subunit beta [Gracilariopsis chorda]
MVYDPFGSASDDPRQQSVQKLVAFRRPPICDVQLTSLEWGAFEARKRTRTEPNRENGQSHAPGQQNAPSRNSAEQIEPQRPQPTVVEKIVYAEPTTIFGIPPVVDDRIRYIVNFILEHVDSSNVEIEVKLGLLIAKEHNVRATQVLPVTCETAINQQSNHETRFESNVGEQMFFNLNNRLNQRVEQTERETKNKVSFTRSRHLDVYYSGNIREVKEIRKRADGSEYYQTIHVQSKTRLGDLNVLCPIAQLDMRYSASREEPAEIQPNMVPTRQRLKDRISYRYEYLSIDITCVHMETLGGTSGSLRTYEVEIEIDSSARLFDEVKKYRQGDDSSKLFDIATCLVNTVRILLEADK